MSPRPFLTGRWFSVHLLDSPDRPWRPLTFSPARLMVPEGANATFTCSFSNTSEHFVLNWYRMSPSNQTDKLAAFPEDSSQPGRSGRFRVTRLPNGRDFHMSVLAARRNDSGIYLCGAISLPPKTQINESPRAELTVTGDPRAGAASRNSLGLRVQWAGTCQAPPHGSVPPPGHRDRWLGPL